MSCQGVHIELIGKRVFVTKYIDASKGVYI